MIGKVWSSRPVRAARSIHHRLAKAPVVTPRSIRWLEPLAITLLFGLLLALVWLVLS